jgi:hypothetical protein
MAIELKYRTNWVSNDESYGYGAVLTFEDGDLSERQLEVYEDLSDRDKFAYIQAILNGDPTDEWDAEEEEDN